MTVVCGSNERVRARIEAAFAGEPRLRVLGQVRPLYGLLDSADVVVTKPGGLTSTEVMQKRLPLVFVSPIEGVETRNAAFLSGEGVALWAKAPGDAARMAGLLLQDARAREAQRAAQARLVSGTAAMDIARDLIARANERREEERHDGQGSPVHPAGVSFGRRHVCISYPAPADGRRRARAGADHNPGAANAFRLCGPTVGVLCALLDVLKATLPVYAAAVYGGLRGLPLAAAALAPVLGHAYPVTLRFRGGKAIASAFGALLGLWPVTHAVLLLAAIVLILLPLVHDHALLNTRSSVLCGADAQYGRTRGASCGDGAAGRRGRAAPARGARGAGGHPRPPAGAAGAPGGRVTPQRQRRAEHFAPRAFMLRSALAAHGDEALKQRQEVGRAPVVGQAGQALGMKLAAQDGQALVLDRPPPRPRASAP